MCDKPESCAAPLSEAGLLDEVREPDDGVLCESDSGIIRDSSVQEQRLTHLIGERVQVQFD